LTELFRKDEELFEKALDLFIKTPWRIDEIALTS